MSSEGAALLLDYLQGQRRHVLEALEGLDEAAMLKPVLPSGWAPVQLVHHLALDDERFWIRAVVSGDQAACNGLSDNAWLVPDGLSVADVLDIYRAESLSSDAVIAGVDLDAPPAWWPVFLGERWLESVREVLMHVIVETAAHAGQLDVVRELIDGKQWRVVTD